MIKATAKGPDGRDILLVGLAFGNLDEFQRRPGNTFIRIDGSETGLPVDVVIFSGETEAKMADMLSGGFGPDTKITISDQLKS